MNRIYISRETDPYFNIATEYQLFLEAKPEAALFLWQNDPAVILGRNQNFYAECDVKYLEQMQILPVRRFSGGGAVFQDLGNVNFTFITQEKAADTEKFLSVIQNAVASLGIDCTFSGRNDLLYHGKKFSGHAYYADNGNYLYHGTVMVDVDMDKLSGVLSPSSLKLQSKGIASVRSRVINLSRINSEITTDAAKEALILAFVKIYGESEPIKYIDRKNLQPELWDTIKREEWIYGEAPSFSISEERKLPFGNVTLSADVAEGRIQRIKIHTDSLNTVDFTILENTCMGELFEIKVLFERIEKYVRYQ
ncbi:Lipoate-protein ligase A [Neobacillus rhizosphaerae]|uniref:lipoate--protein ligase n=1 Tax=Neobacillus rhizosphaerae TaxID=2880965 RepID=A0ABM9EV66_9BACI|nr:lipoate--protein ligase [Neobacillus rhizosphaerae]CAH2716554.1 Lipoate-protein ligase A [Neobacillus rhizosphaerae]